MLELIDPAVIVSDQRMPQMNGIEFLKRAKQRRPDTVGILLTAYADLGVLIEAVNSGAVERYVQKPWDSKELTVILRQAMVSFATVRENRRLREQLAHYAGYLEREQRDPIDFGEIDGQSAQAKELAARIAEVAPTSTHVVLEAEPGSEAEVVARAIHVGSPREERPFVKVTCAAFARANLSDAQRGQRSDPDALERELFGWKRGAFDGAFDDRAGRLELAHGGTLYLEEPALPSPTLAERLLRLLVSGEVQRIGAHEAEPVDVRLVISVPSTLAEAWAGTLPDLLTRLQVFPIRIPALRERPGDVRTLAEHFLRKYARRNRRAATSLSVEALGKLESYGWPGNMRELENVIERAAILARGDVIQAEHLAFGPRPARAPAPRDSMAPGSSAPPPDGGADGSGRAPSVRPEDGDGARAGRVTLDSHLDEIERRELLLALERCGGNKAEVARSLGVQRTTLYYRLKRLGIDT
jgi:DNA-binding NtrC family response regulator